MKHKEQEGRLLFWRQYRGNGDMSDYWRQKCWRPRGKGRETDSFRLYRTLQKMLRI